MQTKQLIIGLLIRFGLLMAVVAPFVAAGHVLALPEIITACVPVVVVLIFAWFQEGLIAWLFPRFAAPSRRGSAAAR
jgi:hypothetical protein